MPAGVDLDAQDRAPRARRHRRLADAPRRRGPQRHVRSPRSPAAAGRPRPPMQAPPHNRNWPHAFPKKCAGASLADHQLASGSGSAARLAPRSGSPAPPPSPPYIFYPSRPRSVAFAHLLSLPVTSFRTCESAVACLSYSTRATRDHIVVALQRGDGQGVSPPRDAAPTLNQGNTKVTKAPGRAGRISLCPFR